MLDNCILDVFEGSIKAAGYIIFLRPHTHGRVFILTDLLTKSILPCLELNNGTKMIGKEILPFPVKYQEILTLTLFEELCAAHRQGPPQKGESSHGYLSIRKARRCSLRQLFGILLFKSDLIRFRLLPSWRLSRPGAGSAVLRGWCARRRNTPEESR